MEKWKETIEFCNKALRFNKKYSKAYNKRGCARMELGQRKDAIVDFATALRIEPENSEYEENLERAKSNQQWKRQEKHYERHQHKGQQQSNHKQHPTHLYR